MLKAVMRSFLILLLLLSLPALAVRYSITSEGRDYDDWMVGGQLTLFGR